MKASLLLFLTLINISEFIMMGVDKRRAIKGERRIRERTLWLYAWLGGALGGLIGMRVFRHKTKHVSFTVGFSMLTIIDIFLFYILLGKMS